MDTRTGAGGPGEAHPGWPAGVVVFKTHRVITRQQGSRRRELYVYRIIPLVHQQLPVHPEPHAAFSLDGETGAPCGQREVALKAGGKTTGRRAGSGASMPQLKST